VSVTFTATGNTNHYILIYAGFTTSRFAGSVDNVTLRIAEEDRSVNDNGLQVFGTITKDPVATGADLVAYSGFLLTRYIKQPYNSDLDFGTGDFCVIAWAYKTNEFSNYMFNLVDNTDTSVLTFADLSGFKAGDTSTTNTVALANTGWRQFIGVRKNGILYYYLDGNLVTSAPSTDDLSLNGGGSLVIGGRQPDGRFWGSNSAGNGTDAGIALFRISATAPTAEQIAKIYEDEKYLFQENSQATLYGSSDAVTALAYDGDTELLHVGTSAGRSVFQGLRRVDNTTGAVGAAISASNGLVAED